MKYAQRDYTLLSTIFLFFIRSSINTWFIFVFLCKVLKRMELYAALYRHPLDKNFSLSLDLEIPPKTMWVVSNIDKHFSRQALFEFLTLKNKKWSVSFLLYAYGIGLTCHRRYFTSRSNWSTPTTVGVILLLCNNSCNTRNTWSPSISQILTTRAPHLI